MNKTNRSFYWTASQKSKWEAAEEREGVKLARTHENCVRILGVARPGKTASDKNR